MNSSRALGILISLCWLAVDSHALTAPPEAERMTAAPGRVDNPNEAKSSVGRALSHARWTFDVPISLEWSFVDENRLTVEREEKGPFKIREGDSLADVLDRACAIEDGKLRWLRLHGSLVILPAPGGGTTESTLDTIVSFNVQSVSTWEALCALARTVNESGATDRTLQFIPGFADGYEGPPQFSEARTISLSLNEVTARDALLAIIEASPVYMEYVYQNLYRPKEGANSRPSSHVTVHPSVPGKNAKDYPFMDRHEMINVWIRDLNAQIPEVPSSAVPPPAPPKE